MAAVTLDELRTERADRVSRLNEIENENAGERFSEDTREEWNRLNAEVDGYDERISEIEVRQARLAEIVSSDDGRTEPAVTYGPVNGARPGQARGGDIFDLYTVRRDFNDPGVEGRELRDRALRAVESAQFPHERADHEAAQGHIERMLNVIDTEDGQIARRILQTGSPLYKRAFGKYLAQRPLSQDESRALSLTSASGGYAVPFVLDPTIIPTSNLAVNPFRAISRVEQITVDEWRGVSSAGITAAYAAEVTASSDNAPTLAQPVISTEKAQAFVPFSIEIGMDWNGLQQEMAGLLQDAKDELEATKFAVGSGTNEPQGVITGAVTVVTASGTASFALADLDLLEAALGPRFRSRATFVCNRFIAQKIRHFDTAGGAAAWNQGVQLVTGLPNQVPTPGSYGVDVLGYPAYESSGMAASIATGQLFAVLGDFRNYLIADRVGLSVELIPHMFDVTNNRPTGQRGIYAYWRNGAGVLAANAFRVLKAG